VNDGKKTFKKYFLANQFTLSSFQDPEGVEDINKQVLDEHQKQMDELVAFGDGTSNSDVKNAGLYYSNDANFLLESSVEVDEGVAEDHLKDMHTKIMATVAKADVNAGEKLLIIYGAVACAKYDSLYANTDAPFKRVLSEVLGSDWTVVKMPLSITPSNANGWIAVNRDQIKLHYTQLPALDDQGINDEKKYAWFNFLMGSAMIEVLVANGIILQPVTFEI
jgi:hypothetical protein